MMTEIAAKKPGAWSALWSGAGLVFHRQRVLWWLFLVNFLLGMAAMLPVRRALADVLDHSLASLSMASHFDITAFVEAVRSPYFNFGSFAGFSVFASLLFALVVLFAEAGIIQEFRQAAGAHGPSQRQTGGEFFGACGLFFGRMARLLLWSLVPLAVVGIFYEVIRGTTQAIAGDSPDENVGMRLDLLCGLILFLLFTVVRAWIDMAKIYTVATGERAARHGFFGAARRLAFGNMGKLFTIQLVPSLAAFAVLLLGLTVWMKHVPPARVGLAFLVSELTLLSMLGCRLWQRAAVVVWYERHAAWRRALEPIPQPEPQPLSPLEEPLPVAEIPASEIHPQLQEIANPALPPPAPSGSPDDGSDGAAGT